MGYTIIGDKIDTNDWDERLKKTPQSITQDVLDQLKIMKTKPQFRGSIILLHDGGGDRAITVAALPVLIDTLRARGYKIVQVSDLMGSTRAEVMPDLTPKERWQARVDSVAFFAFSFFSHFVVMVFFLGDVLMSARLILVGIFALHRPAARKHDPEGAAELLPAGRRPDPCIQRREGDRAHDPLGAELRLRQPARDRDRRRLLRPHL